MRAIKTCDGMIVVGISLRCASLSAPHMCLLSTKSTLAIQKDTLSTAPAKLDSPLPQRAPGTRMLTRAMTARGSQWK